MNALRFAWLSLVRQPARALLGVLGVAAVAALLFDMLLLSQGLVLSMRDLFDRAGFDLRVTSTDSLPGQGPRMRDGLVDAGAIARLPAVRAAVAVRFADAVIEGEGRNRLRASFQGVGGSGIRPWTVLRGRDIRDADELLINQHVADVLRVGPGSHLRLRPACAEGPESLPPVTFEVAGVADFPFDTPSGATIATGMRALNAACGNNEANQADVIMVASAD
jgi:hypothetical protein